MGAWGSEVGESDTFADVYGRFFDLYNDGAAPELASERVRAEFAEYFADYDDRHDSHFALAFAQWETQSLEPALLRTVEELVAAGADVEAWGPDAPKRAAALERFLEKLRTPRPSKKRRKKRKFDFAQRVLLDLPSPDGRKTFSVSESYVDGEYVNTSATMMWEGGGGAVFHGRQPGLAFSGRWIDAQTLEIEIPKSLEQELRNDPLARLDQAYFSGETVKLRCRFV